MLTQSFLNIPDRLDRIPWILIIAGRLSKDFKFVSHGFCKDDYGFKFLGVPRLLQDTDSFFFHSSTLQKKNNSLLWKSFEKNVLLTFGLWKFIFYSFKF